MNPGNRVQGVRLIVPLAVLAALALAATALAATGKLPFADAGKGEGTGKGPTPSCQGKPATLVGSGGPDRGDDALVGTSKRDVVVALAGDDVIRTKGGKDLVCAGGGDDDVGLGAGDDRAKGRAGDDAMRGGQGDDFLAGGGGDDGLRGGAGDDKLRGGQGTDSCSGGAGADKQRGCENPGSDPGPGSENDGPGGGPGGQGSGGDGDGGGPGGGGSTPTPVDQPPSAADDARTVTEDDPATSFDVRANDTDLDGGPITIESVSDPANGSAQVTGAGATVDYTPDSDYCNSPGAAPADTFTYTLNGGSSATVSVTVTCVDDAAVAADDARTVTEDDPATSFDVRSNDSDVEGDPIQVTAVSDPANGTTAITGGGDTVDYTPDPDYCNAPPGTAPDTFTYTVNGGDTATVSVTVSCVDDPPSAVDDDATVDEDSGANAIDVRANDVDPDGANQIDSKTNGANGAVAITGGGAELTYTPNPDYCGPDSFTYTLAPAGSGNETATVSVTVTCVNDAPTLDLDDTDASDDSAATFTEDGGPVDLAPNAALADVDDANLDSATITLTNRPDGADESLAVSVGATGITANYTPATGVLALSNSAPKADYQQVLRTLEYDNSDQDPDTANRVVTVKVNDGDADSPTRTATVTVNAQNDAPAVDLNGGDPGTGSEATFNEPDPPPTTPVAIAPNAEVADPDDANLESATVTLTNTPDGTDESLAADITGTPITANYDSGTGVLSLSGSATKADYQTVLRTVTYDNTAAPPDPADRLVDVEVNDGDADSNTATATVHVVPLNDPPTLDLDNTTGSNDVSSAFVEDAGPDTLAPNADVADSDDANLASATVVLTNRPDGDGTESLDANVGATPIAKSYTAATGTLSLTGSATVADYQQVLRTVAYDNTSDTPTTTDRSVTFVVNDGQDDSALRTATVSVTAVNDNPVVDLNGTGTGGIDVTRTFTEDDPAITLASATDVTDVDNTEMASATVTLTNRPDGADESLDADTTGFAGITETAYNGTTGELVLTGPDLNDNFAQVLRTVTYDNADQDPDPTERTITFKVSDGSNDSANATASVTVNVVNDPPVADLNGVGAGIDSTADFVEDSPAVSLAASGTVTDVDNSNIVSATITLTNPQDGGAESLSVSTAGTSVSAAGNNSHAITLSTSRPKAEYQTVLQTLKYDNTSNTPNTTDRDVTVKVNDGAVDSTVAHSTVTVTATNDAPVADDETFNANDSAIGNTTMQVDDPDDNKPPPANPHTEIAGDILAGDDDPDGPTPLTITPGTFATNDGGSVTLESDGDFVFQPAAATSCTDSSDFFDYTVNDNDLTDPKTDTGRVTIAIASCVWYVSNNAAGNAGTSTQPFDTTAQAEIASGANHTTFVFDGDNTSTGYATGYAMNSGERLIGEHEGLTVDPDQGGPLTADTLWPASPGAHPTLAATNEDVVELDDGTEVRGFNLDPSGTGSGIAGASGDTGGGTIDDVNIVDTGTAGSQPGLELDATTGTFNVSNLLVNNQAATSPPNTATGVRLNSAGTVNFNPTGQTSIATTGAKGLEAIATNMGSGSVFDDITVSGSSVGGVSLSSASGTTTFGDGTGTDLSLTTTSGPTAAFGVANSGTVSVAAAGSDDVRATGGPAVDVTGTSGASLAFDDVDSTNSANDGVNLAGLGTGTFSASSGDIGGAAGISFDLDGGTGAITYPGNLNNGSGTTAVEVTGRGGGAVTLSGAISDTADAGGAISLSGNTSGSTTFSNGTKQLNTGATNAVSFTSSDGHTLNLTGGGLDIDTGAGAGVNATTSGTIQVSGSGNTIDTGAGTALNVTNTDIAAADLTFQRISANGGTNGIVLNTTGSNGGLTVVGDGTNNGSGGTIQNTSGNGVQLSNTRDASLTSMSIQNTGGSGIDGTGVTNFTFNRGTINNSGNSDFESNIAFNDTDGGAPPAGLGNNINGTLTVTNSTLNNAFNSGVDIRGNDGTLSNANISDNSITPKSGATEGFFGINIVGTGNASTRFNLTKATIQNNEIGLTNAGIQVSMGNTNASGTGATAGVVGSATNIISITGNDTLLKSAGTHAIAVGSDGGNTGSRSQMNFEIKNNGTVADPINGSSGGHVVLVGNNGASDMSGVIENNVIDANHTAGTTGGNAISGGNGVVTATGTEEPELDLTVTNNVVTDTDGNGILLVGRGTSGHADLTITNNDVEAPLAGVRPGIRVDAGNASSGDDEICLDIQNNVSAGSGGHQGIGLRKQGTVTTTNDFAIEGMAATASPGVEAYVDGKNPSGNGTLLISAASGFSNCNTAP